MVKKNIYGINHKMISIVIPTYNNLDYLKLCLKSLKQNSIFDHEIELTYQSKLDILTNDLRLIAMTMEKNKIRSLIIDKQNNFWTLFSWFNF